MLVAILALPNPRSLATCLSSLKTLSCRLTSISTRFIMPSAEVDQATLVATVVVQEAAEVKVDLKEVIRGLIVAISRAQETVVIATSA